jgi:tRNA C32,U32 (ribose-2'-O)-methylase TrmJ
MRMWREMLLRIGFMQADTADHMMQGLQRIFSRGAVTVDDVHILMGVARQVEWASAARGRDGRAADENAGRKEAT